VSYLLDTDICSAHLKQQTSVSSRFLQHLGQLHTSVLSVGELLTWACRRAAPAQRTRNVRDLLNDVTVLPVTDEIAAEFGRLRATLLDAGRPTPIIDLWIAATAIQHGLTIVTHNVRDFAHVPGVAVEDWVAP